MRLETFDFHLPKQKIALRPVKPRDSARLLVIDPSATGKLEDFQCRDLPSLLMPGDILVLNDTKVLSAALCGERLRGDFRAQITLNLHRYEGEYRWRAFARPAKKLSVGDKIYFAEAPDMPWAKIMARSGPEITLLFQFPDPALADENAMFRAIEKIGKMPLPPYIERARAADEADRADYQTVFAQNPGAVAAPTAGLHFTPELFSRLSAAKIERYMVTLHVGAGTFLPVKSDNIGDHPMHSEYCLLSAKTALALNKARDEGRRIIAVGTTVARLLESALDIEGRFCAFAGPTALFILPGYQFCAIDGLITNFHLPRSTLFMLVCALAGTERMQAAYRHAIADNYRFYSYGDACLIWRGQQEAAASDG